MPDSEDRTRRAIDDAWSSAPGRGHSREQRKRGAFQTLKRNSTCYPHCATLASMSARVKCALYLRQSLDLTGEGLAVDRQREDDRKLAARRGWQITAERVDNDISAAGKKRRPGFEQLLAGWRDRPERVVYQPEGRI